MMDEPTVNTATHTDLFGVNGNFSGYYIDLLPLQIRAIHQVCDKIFGVLSLLANAILAVLLSTEHNDVLSAYSWVLTQNCIVDVLSTITILASQLVSRVRRNRHFHNFHNAHFGKIVSCRR